MKKVVATILAMFAVNAFAADAAKKDEKKAEKPAEKKAEAKK